MVEAAHQALEKFVKTKEAAAVLIDSSGDKAFCAGQLCGSSMRAWLIILQAGQPKTQ